MHRIWAGPDARRPLPPGLAADHFDIGGNAADDSEIMA